MIGHTGFDVPKTRPQSVFVQAIAKIDDAVSSSGNFRINDVRRCAIENQKPDMRQ